MTWKQYEDQAESGPWGFFIAGVVVIALICALALVTSILSRGCSVVNEAANVAQKEIGPSALLRKYEWFKNAAAQLDKKRADISVYEAQIVSGQKRSHDRFTDDRVFQWETECMGIKASYNSLAAEYNAQMAKINWRFTNIGMLPPGASDPLPREFKPYVLE